MKKNGIMGVREQVYNFNTKHQQGFTEIEIDLLLKDYPDINMDKFNNALMGNTCMLTDDNEIVMYHCDIYRALVCGIENRNLGIEEWD